MKIFNYYLPQYNRRLGTLWTYDDKPWQLTIYMPNWEYHELVANRPTTRVLNETTFINTTLREFDQAVCDSIQSRDLWLNNIKYAGELGVASFVELT